MMRTLIAKGILCSSEGNDSFDEVSLDDNHVHVDSK